MMLPGHRGCACRLRNHGDAPIHWAGEIAQVAADAFGVDDLVAALSVHPQRGDRLMGSVLAADMAQAAFDAERLIDAGDLLEVQIQVTPEYVVGHRASTYLIDGPIFLAVHPVRQA